MKKAVLDFLSSSKKLPLNQGDLAWQMTNLYPFIQGSLEWPFSELFSANVSLWNQYQYIAFNIFSCRILIISYKMLIITRISNEKTNELTMYGILCWNVTIFYRLELASLIQVQEKLKTCTLESRIIGGVGIIGVLDIAIIINNRRGWTGLKK